jgi:L-alanine-DL-glutamate epimerase-like enolase superfamily enzyme
MRVDAYSGRAGDIRVRSAQVRFRHVALDPPFVISGRPLTHLTAVTVRLEVVARDGGTAAGIGVGMLSAPWSWPFSALDLGTRDRMMRDLVRELAALAAVPVAGDPFVLWRPLYEQLDTVLAQAPRRAGIESIPRLAGLLALGPVDNALHDAWSRAAGLPLASMYTAQHLREDLGRYGELGRALHPSDTLRPPRRALPVQHALGVGDPLTAADAAPGVRDLEDWIRAEGVHHLKLKLSGEVPADLERLRAVHHVAAPLRPELRLSLDPNESYALPALAELLDTLSREDPALLAAIDYLEQPVSREEEPDPAELRRLSARIPVLLDEGYSRISQLSTLAEQGWSGIVIKGAKGQSHAMITQALASAAGLRIAIQDLTAVDLALEHSLGLAAVLPVSWPAVECNSRQFAPDANAELASRRPESVFVRDGQVRWRAGGLGLSGVPARRSTVPLSTTC